MYYQEDNDNFKTIVEIIHNEDLEKLQQKLDEGFDINRSFSRYQNDRTGRVFGKSKIRDQTNLFIQIIRCGWMEGFEACICAGVDIEKPDLKVQ